MNIHDVRALFDAAAEAMILVDPTDAQSTAELVERLVAVRDALGVAEDAKHPATMAAACALQVAQGDESALGGLDKHYAAARARAEKDARDDAPQRPKGPAPARARVRREKKPTAAPASVMPLAGDEELLRDFALRATEHLDDADEALLRLEADFSDSASMDAVFRTFHTIKGMAGFLSLDAVSALAHTSEGLLAELRSGGAQTDDMTVQAIFLAVDDMRKLVEVAASGGHDILTETDKGDPAPASPAGSAGAVESARRGTLRMDEERLDSLLDTIGELVIAESVVSSATRSHADEVTLLGQLERLDKITRELQQMATSLRMVPMRSTFRRMARLVRDLAHSAGKQVDFVTRGEDAELDKTVVDRIEDPLIHALRNAVDHGIETAEERVAAGKSPLARIELRAFHAGGSIHVEVSDDGRGLDLDRIFAKAISVGLAEAGERPSDDRLSDLVFTPGFSTADAVTDVSGRGVGMDVVRRTVEELRGRIRLQTAPSGGTTVSMRLPVTLAIIDGMVIRVCDARYVVPTLSVVRSVRPEASEVTRVLGTGEVLQIADGLLRLVRLRSLFSLSTADDESTDSIVMIVESDSGQVGLVVDEIVGQQQIVIKPLGNALGDVAGVSGGAVMPDGQVGLILDVEELVMLANEG